MPARTTGPVAVPADDAGTPATARASSAAGGVPAVRPPGRLRHRLWRTPLAAAGGLLLVLAYPGYDRPGLALLGPAALALAVHGRRLRTGMWLGLVFGLAFFVPLLSWTGIYVGPLPWLALAGWEALHLVLLGGATALVSRLRWWPLWSAALWVADEAVRGRFVLGGFPWGRLGLSQTEGPLLSLAAYGGVPLVSFAVALEGTLLAAAVPALYRAWRAASAAAQPAGPSRTAALVTAVLAVVAIAAVPAVGLLAWLPLPGPSLTAGGPSVTVAVVQGNVPRLGLDFNAQRRAVLDNHVQQTLDLAGDVAAGRSAQPDVVLWPENSSDIDPYRNADAAQRISRAAAVVKAPILVGAVVDGSAGTLRNTAIVWDPRTGPGRTYVKRHPVPLAEYVPARRFFRFFSSKVDLVRADFVAGSAPGNLAAGGARLGDLICFEVVYDSLVRDVVNGGAGMLVVQTNNATFGHTDESAQQLAMSRLRAVEFGRTVAVAATSGISAIIAPDGSVVRASALFTPATFVERIAQRSSTTVAQRLGGIPEVLVTGLGAVALLVVCGSAVRGRGNRRGATDE